MIDEIGYSIPDMTRTIRTLIHICLFRARPQDLPACGRTLTFTILAAFVFSVMRITPFSEGGAAVMVSLAQIGLLALGLKILLSLFSRHERWLQSATAVFGCSALLTLAAILMRIITESFVSGAVNPILAAINIWSFAVIVFILRETLEVRLLLAFLITFTLEVLSVLILQQILGGQIS